MTNRNVHLSPEAAARLPDAAKLAHMVEIDYYAVLQNRQAWVDRFQREVISQ